MNVDVAGRPRKLEKSRRKKTLEKAKEQQEDWVKWLPQSSRRFTHVSAQAA